jgi:MFS family permease
MATSTTASVLKPAVLIVYAAGLLQGLTLVSFPALSSVFTQSLGFSAAEYGAVFLPQVTLAVVGATAGGALAGRLGLKQLLICALLANALSQLFLATAAFAGDAAFLSVMVATAALGFGFGLVGAPINSYPPTLFPAQPHASVVAAHTLIGLGLATGPVVAGVFLAMGAWFAFPLVLAALAVGLAAATAATAAGVARRCCGRAPLSHLRASVLVLLRHHRPLRLCRRHLC